MPSPAGTFFWQGLCEECIEGSVCAGSSGSAPLSVGVWIQSRGFPDPREDPKSRSPKGGYPAPFSSQGPKLGDLLFRSFRESGFWTWGFWDGAEDTGLGVVWFRSSTQNSGGSISQGGSSKVPFGS